jgi:O-antigen ligase
LTRLIHLLLATSIVWGTFAFGAVYAWAYWPLIIASSVIGISGCCVRSPQRLPKLSHTKRLAIGLLGFGLLGALQLVPVSLPFLSTLSPTSVQVISQLNLAVAAGVTDQHPISISPRSTVTALIIFAANAVLLLGCVRLFSMKGARRAGEVIAVAGVAVALCGIVQSRLFNGSIYGFWTPIDGGNPFGPFVNRNHFAGWMLMALPVSLGLLCGGIARAMPGVKPGWRARVLWCSSPQASRLILLALGTMIMALSLLMTMSRSGISALGVAIALTAIFVARRQTHGRRLLNVAYLLVLIGVTVGWAGADLISARFAETDWAQLNDRRGAWLDAIHIATKFPAAGIGLNTYGTATLFFQQHDLARHYSHAHNDYLQLVAEGGVLLAIPALLCLGVLIVDVRQRFLEETSQRNYWLRVGASTGLLAIALQETVDFSLQIPANAMLFAVVCAIALHRTPPVAPRPVNHPSIP